MLTIAEMEQLRNELGIRYAMIAEETGLPVSTLQKVMSGKTRSPRPEVLFKLRQFFAGYGYGLIFDTKGRYIGPYAENDPSVRETPAPYYGTEVIDDTPVVYEEWPHEKRTDRLYTVEDLESFPEDFHVELIDGELYYLSAARTVHQEIQMVISAAFFNFIQANHGTCKVYPAGFGVQLDEDNYTEVIPDITVCCEPEKITEKGLIGAPHLVVEILSPSNWKKDAILKFKKYVGAGVREYWIVDPKKRTVQVFRKGSETCCDFYTFEDPVPVGIWDGKLTVRLADHQL